MSAPRLQWFGVPIFSSRKEKKQAEERLRSALRLLQRQRASQAAAMLRLDYETEEVKRRITAAQMRLRYLRDERTLDWIQELLPEEKRLRLRMDEHKHSPSNVRPAAEAPKEPAAPKPMLGDRLLADRVIAQEQFDAAMAQQKQFGGRLGDILISLGYVTAEQLLPYVSMSSNKARLGDMLVQSGHITQDQLLKALAFQRKSGGMLGDILLSLQFLEPEQLYRAIATQNQIGRIGSDMELDSLVRLPEAIAREYGVVIIHEYSNRYLLAVNEPLDDERKQVLEHTLKRPIEQVLASKNEMEMFWSEVYGDEMLHESTSKLAIEQPHNSASVTFTKAQIAAFGVMAAIFVAGIAWNPLMTLIISNVLAQLFYFTMTFFKFSIIMFGSRSGAQYRFTEEEIAAIDERDLPVYTILVPMYKESNVIPHLIGNMEKLDYPKAKLDIRLLIEKDDTEAIEILKNMNLPSYYSVLVVPDSLPKTKPKACNFGLIRARGEYVVIYDAEDKPDPDQLKKVYLTFQACGDDTVCVQAKLNYFNSEQNLLTRWFTQEYSMWFELLLPGIMKLDIPIPLGGTSNHFKIEPLKALNAWDPYNVTEDADLGIRLYKAGHKTAIVDSRTWEEANSHFGNWIRQRSRWIKGYMQTWLVHMRNPFKLYRELGTRGFFGFQVMVLATPLVPLLNPVFWLMVLLWYGVHLEVIRQFFPGIIYYLSAIELFAANFFFVYSNIAGIYWVIQDLENRDRIKMSHRLVKYALLTPLYWGMMSIASYKALWQLVVKPFYWEKTVHGLDKKPVELRDDGLEHRQITH